MPDQQPDTRTRRDALENRERILQAARELYAQVGVGVTLHDVVRHAGFGVGTAYRNFLNKEELIDIVLSPKLQILVEIGRRCLGAPDPWMGMTCFLDESLKMQAADRGFSQVLNDPRYDSARLTAARDEVSAQIEAMVDRLKQGGLIRPGITGTDVQLLHVALAGLLDRARPVRPTHHRKYLAVVLDGLRPSHDVTTPPPRHVPWDCARG